MPDKIGDIAVRLVMLIVMPFVTIFLLYCLANFLALFAGPPRYKKDQEERRRQEEEKKRRWNSPEEVKRRRLETESRKAIADELERKRQAADESLARERWAKYHRYPRFDEIDAMGGIPFELFVMGLLGRTAFTDIRTTPVSGDQGADLLAVTPDRKKAVVQTKRWRGAVGNGAIQEVLGAMLFYDAEVAFVFTNSNFTDAAKALARKDRRICLVDRAELGRMIQQAFDLPVPEFDWESYNKVVRNWKGW